MFNLAHLVAERGHKARTAQEIIDKAEKAEGGPRPLTQDECKLIDQLQTEIKNLDVQIQDIQEHEKRRAEIQATTDRLNQPTGRITAPDNPAKPNDIAANGTGTLTTRVPATARRSGRLRAFKGPEAETNAYRAGMWARATLFNDIRAQHKCLSLGIDIRGAMSTTSNPDGGFLVPDEFSRAIIDLREEYGVFRREARVWPMGSDTLLIPRRAGGVTIGPINENPSSAISQSNPTFGMVQLVAKKAGGLCLMSSEIAEDAVIDLADYLAQEFAYAFALFEDQCGFLGDGTSTYLGITGLGSILTEASGLKGAVSVATASHDLFSEIDATDLTTMMAQLPQYAKMNAKFYVSSVAKSLVFDRLMAGAGGNNVQTLQGTTGENYLGYPIVVSQVLPSVTTALDAVPMLYFGDLKKAAALGDRRQVKVFASEHRYMDTDQIGIRGTERFDIVIHDYGTTTVAGPIVALVGSTS